jgi:hypothetical protein
VLRQGRGSHAQLTPKVSLPDRPAVAGLDGFCHTVENEPQPLSHSCLSFERFDPVDHLLLEPLPSITIFKGRVRPKHADQPACLLLPLKCEFRFWDAVASRPEGAGMSSNAADQIAGSYRTDARCGKVL